MDRTAMPRVDALWKSTEFQRHLHNLGDLEQNRIYCRHGLPHLLDVARIMRIRALADGVKINPEVLYAAALLHDIGKDEQYETGIIPHDVASERVARELLDALPASLRFSSADMERICTAILGHRHLRADAEPLERMLYEADKASRACFACKARVTCSWSDEKKNLRLEI